VCLNVAPDHVDYFGDLDAYVRAKAKVYDRTAVAAVYPAYDPAVEQMVADADLARGCRAVGIGLGVPAAGSLGVVDGMLVDRAFVDDPQRQGEELASVDDVSPSAPHQVSNALAAAALARAYGVPAAAVRQGLRDFVPAGHRIAAVGEVAGVSYVDDSKATNWHAALTSLRAFESVVWIAGGQAKGQDFDELVSQAAPRMRAAVLLGVDRDVILECLARHAPQVPVDVVESTHTGAMDEAVTAAARRAERGDTVLLAPGCASRDMYTDYAERGEAFAAAVRRLAAQQESPR
jgi:UDP-N-acetylmuramoylalanine--D-glutamate ligase